MTTGLDRFWLSIRFGFGIGFRGLVLLLFLGGGFTSWSADINDILGSWPSRLSGIQLTLKETTVSQRLSISSNSVSQILQQIDDSDLGKTNSQLLKKMLSRNLEEHSSRESDLGTPATNHITHVYRFERDSIYLTSAGTKLVNGAVENRLLIKDGEEWEATKFGSNATSGTMGAMVGEVRKSAKNIHGYPIFLTPGILAEFVRSHSTSNLQITNAEVGGRGCSLVSVKASPPAPPYTYTICVGDDHIPLEMRIFNPNGSLHSVSTFEYKQAGEEKVLASALTQTYSQGKLSGSTSWLLQRVDPAGTIPQDREEFFAYGTRVSDLRWSKPIFYTMGTRMPSEEEIKEMQAAPRGVVGYQLSSVSAEELKHLRNTQQESRDAAQERRQRSRLFMLLVIATSSALLVYVWRSKRGKPSG